MMVCAHGDVADYCKERDMYILETWDGELRDYDGHCCIVVTDQNMTESEYYFLKGEFLARGMELISTRYRDDKLMAGYLAYAAEQRKETGATRQIFGFRVDNGTIVAIPELIMVARRILKLRDEGATLREIQSDDQVYHRDGRKLSISTIQKIIKNRSKYD